MKAKLFIFVSIGQVRECEVYSDKAEWEKRLLYEMGLSSLEGGDVQSTFGEWAKSQKGFPRKQYIACAKQVEIPVKVLVGSEGGVFTGASATHAGIDLEFFDWDDETEELGAAKAEDKFWEMVDDMVTIA
jgi:hypothetical protein